MDPDIPDIQISDVVISVKGRDAGDLFYVIGKEADMLLLANGWNRPVEAPKRKKQKHVEKVLRTETEIAAKILSGERVLNGELRKNLAFLSRGMQANNLGG